MMGPRVWRGGARVRRRGVAVVLASVLVLSSLPLGVAAVASNLVFTPTADAYVRARFPASTKGSDIVLKVEGDPIVRSYIRFSVTGIPEGGVVRTARLRLFALGTHPVGISVHGGVPADAWSEATISYENAPAFDPTPIDSSGRITTSGSWVELVVTSLVTGNGPVDLVIATTSGRPLQFSSREADEGLRPQLVVAYVAEDPSGEGDAIFVGAGDIAAEPSGRAGPDEETAKLLDAIVAANPGRVTVFTTGDNAYSSGTPSEYADFYDPTWGRHKAITRPVPGNHDYQTAGATGYFGYFGNAAGEPGKGYYAYDLGAWRIYALNSQIDRHQGSEQELWLRADLAAHSDTTCVLAYWHYPRFSSGSHGSNTSVAPFWRALYDYGAELVLVGHDHNYQRFAPQTPSGARNDSRGIREFVVGTGGRHAYKFATPIANTEAYNVDTAGVLKLTLRPASYDFEFIPIAGKTYTDRGSDIACH